MDTNVFLILTLVVLAEADFNLPRKRSCSFNLLGSDCDYTPMAGMSKDHSFRMSLDGPGKKRSSTIPQRSLREIVNKRRQLSYIKSLLQDLDDKLEKLEKRSCLINMPGLNCDFNQMVGTGKDLGVWSSLAAPGRKRRFRRSLRNLL
ncbi:unnamed protein product [Larinioides sclopetarius]|uniref:Uncharacterized protein n=1 Tax=Larinioides sclopetarius TaxID=280406 RepID=A0AAV1ZLI3_9ARAC